MKVLLLGATGNLGSRLLPALLAHNHKVVACVRSEAKLKDLFGPDIPSTVTFVTDGKNAANIRDALVQHKCDAVVNTAGLGSVFPWQAPRMQDIVAAVATAAVEASVLLGRPIRSWFLGGMSALDYPGMGGVKLMRYVPMFTEHALTYALLSTKPAENLEWSMLCPSVMEAAEPSAALLAAPRGNSLSAAADMPPNWQDSYFGFIPFLGPMICTMGNFMRYNTKLEDCADFIAADLETGDRKFVGHRVGVIETGKGKVE